MKRTLTAPGTVQMVTDGNLLLKLNISHANFNKSNLMELSMMVSRNSLIPYIIYCQGNNNKLRKLQNMPKSFLIHKSNS